MELLILSYSVHSLSLISQQYWDMGCSRRVEVSFPLSGSKSVLVGSIAALLPPVLLSSSGAGQLVANGVAET